MMRASTPTHEFELECGKETIKRLLVTYMQNDKIVLEKTENDVSWNGNVAYCRLTQEETLKFDDKQSVEIQVRVLTVDGCAPPTQIFRLPCSRVLNPEVLA